MRKNQSNNFLLENDLEWENLEAGVSRQIMGYNEQIMMVKVKFEKGAMGYEHHHPHIQTKLIESGIFEININNEKNFEKGRRIFCSGQH